MKEWEFDYKTCAELCHGNNQMRLFAVNAKWLYEDRKSINNMLIDMRKTIAARDAEIALLKQALLDARQLNFMERTE